MVAAVRGAGRLQGKEREGRDQKTEASDTM